MKSLFLRLCCDGILDEARRNIPVWKRYAYSPSCQGRVKVEQTGNITALDGKEDIFDRSIAYKSSSSNKPQI